MSALLKLIGAVAGGYILYALWWRKNPSACPYAQRFWLEIPHPIVTRERFARVIDLQPGERVLEIGPGTGYYTRDIARAVGPDGAVDIFDLQQKMLDTTMGRVEADGLTDLVTPTRGDATALPYEDASFDAVTMTAVLGEIPDQAAALAEIARVLKPGGRYVVGEMVLDPHYVRRDKLTDLCGDAGLAGGTFDGPKAGYIARFTRPGS